MSDNTYTGIHFATSYALKADELYYKFPTKKYIRLKKEDLPKQYGNKFQDLYGDIFRYFFFLLLNDVIDNQVIFKFPPGAHKAWIQMDAVTGEDFERAVQKGAFQDVDFLASNFTGYEMNLRYNTRYGHWKKRIYVSKRMKDRITKRTNEGKGW